MGKGERGKSESAIRDYAEPAYQGSANLAGQAGNIMYGSPAASPISDKKARAVAGKGYTQQPKAQQRQATDVNMTQTSPGNYAQDNKDYQGIMRNLIGDKPLTTATMKELEPQLAQYGMKFVWNATNERPDIVLPSGEQIDFVYNMGGQSGTQKFQWNSVSGGEGSPGGKIQPTGGSAGGGTTAPAGSMTGPGGVAGGTLADYANIQNQMQQFADTGGYSPEQLANIRARSVSPIRSIYSGARRDIDRQRSLQGGYSPNRTASLAKMAREQSSATADASTNVEAALAQMVNQGQRYGLSGLAGMYGSTPGLASTFGNQALQAQGLQNQMGLGMVNAQMGASQLPGAWETTLGRAGQIGGAVLPFLSDRNAKKDIKKAPRILSKLKKLPIYKWKYKDDDTEHIGPMAQDFHKLFGGPSNKLIYPVDVAGVTLSALKEMAEGHK